MNALDVCILGDGIVGHVLALLLARQGLRVHMQIQAQAPAATQDIRAYALNPRSRSVLESVGVWPSPDHATPVLAMHIFDTQHHAGTVPVLHFAAPAASEGSAAALNWIADVPQLTSMLRTACASENRISQSEQAVPATLTVVCEGKHSLTRRNLGVEFHPKPYPQRAIATRFTSTQPHQQTACQWFEGKNILGLLPLGGPDGHDWALVWSAEAALAQSLLACTDEAFAQELEMRVGSRTGPLTLTGPRQSWPLSWAMAQTWVGAWPDAADAVNARPGATRRSFALAGDAAHCVHPLAGQGLNLGLADASTLAQTLARKDYWRPLSDMRVLRQYERARKAETWAMGSACDTLQAVYALTQPNIATLRKWATLTLDKGRPIKTSLITWAAGAA